MQKEIIILSIDWDEEDIESYRGVVIKIGDFRYGVYSGDSLVDWMTAKGLLGAVFTKDEMLHNVFESSTVSFYSFRGGKLFAECPLDTELTNKAKQQFAQLFEDFTDKLMESWKSEREKQKGAKNDPNCTWN